MTTEATNQNPIQSYFQRYGQSKIGSIFLAKGLAERYPQLTVPAVHPGRVVTGMARGLQQESRLIWLMTPLSPLMCTPLENGVKNHLWAATAPGVISGKYYEPVGVPDKEDKIAHDANLQKKLWEWTENAFKEHGV
jgi:retinol dehydrogenase 12